MPGSKLSFYEYVDDHVCHDAAILKGPFLKNFFWKNKSSLLSRIDILTILSVYYLLGGTMSGSEVWFIPIFLVGWMIVFGGVVLMFLLRRPGIKLTDLWSHFRHVAIEMQIAFTTGRGDFAFSHSLGQERSLGWVDYTANSIIARIAGFRPIDPT